MITNGHWVADANEPGGELGLRGAGGTNYPANTGYGVLYTIGGQSKYWYAQMFFGISSGDAWVRCRNDIFVWTAWQKLTS